MEFRRVLFRSSNASTTLTESNSTFNGPGALINAAGKTLTLTNGTINAPVTNQGLLTVTGTVAVNGALTTAPGSTLRVEGGTNSHGLLTVLDEIGRASCRERG